MAKTKTEIFTLIGSELPDNTTGQITPAKLRGVLTQMADSPIYTTPGVKEVEVLRAASTIAQAATVTAWGTAPSALLVISRLEAA
ncbi:hypothetical protein [Escherichia phage ULINTec2]|uniref:Uncharacterized protein n=1 Tax=Escherichia phage ULINTec2 TaxID=2876728 RepID=A0AAE8Y1S6_9CAUD|nr:hypothetical protein [Escherichia phage ULINTec2]